MVTLKNKITKPISLSDGILKFICPCGRIGQVKLREYSGLTRCEYCNEATKKNHLEEYPVPKEQLKLLFETMFENGLYEFLNNGATTINKTTDWSCPPCNDDDEEV